MLREARDEYNVGLVPIKVQSRDCGDCMYFEVQITPYACIRANKDQATWVESYTKLLAFNQTHYNRVLPFDSEATMLQVCLKYRICVDFTKII